MDVKHHVYLLTIYTLLSFNAGPLRLSFLFKKVVVCGHCLVTLSITSYWNIKMVLIAAHLNAGIILVVTV